MHSICGVLENKQVVGVVVADAPQDVLIGTGDVAPLQQPHQPLIHICGGRWQCKLGLLLSWAGGWLAARYDPLAATGSCLHVDTMEAIAISTSGSPTPGQAKPRHTQQVMRSLAARCP